MIDNQQMTFTITYRGADGALKRDCIEAASRAECAAQCRVRGITPISISEDKKAKPSASRQRSGKCSGGDAHPFSRPVLRAVIVAVVFAAVIGVWWMLQSRRPTAPKPVSPSAHPTSTSTAVSNAPAPSAVVTVRNSNVQHQASSPQPLPLPPSDPYGGVWRGQKITSYTVTTNGWSTYERIVTADGKSHGIVGSTVKPLFDNASDQMLALAVRSANEEMPPMPLSPMLERDFMESLKKEIVIKDDDPEEVKQIKRDVIAAREDMLTMVGNGMTVEQALAEHFKLSNENAGIRAQAVEELRKILDSGDREGAEKYMETVNASLEKMGIMKLELPEERVRGRKRRERAEEKE